MRKSRRSWVDVSAPRGDVADMPKPPAKPDGWTIGKPDAVFSMTEDFAIPATGTIDYKYIRVPVNLPEDRWYTAVEIKPSARVDVNHSSPTPSRTAISRHGKAAPSGRRTSPASRRTSPASSSSLVSRNCCAPDTTSSWRSTTRPTAAATDRTQVGFVFATEAPAKVHVTGLAVQPKFLIRAGDTNAR